MDKATLIALFVGGGLALAGTIVSQIFGLFSGRIERRHQRDVRRRERLEQMADAVSATIVWCQSLTRCRTLEEISEHQPPPESRRIMTLAFLYFDRLVNPAAAYVNGLVRYYHFATECYRPNQPATIGALMVMAASRDPEANRRQHEPTILRQRLDDAITAEAKKYVHA